MHHPGTSVKTSSFRSGIAIVAATACLGACGARTPRLDQLHIETLETGAVPASTLTNLPAAEDVVVFTRGSGGFDTAAFRHTVACPSRMINSVSGILVKPDRIQLCFEPIEAHSPEARPLSSCPYPLAIKYELAGIPASVTPAFEVVGRCTGKR